jgi:hypothetical protein
MNKPNFSGIWKFNPGLSTLQINAPDSSLFIVEHEEPNFRFERKHIFGGKEDTFSMNLIINNNSISINRQGTEIKAHCYWESNTLVFDTVLTRGNQKARNTVRYSLAEDKESFTAEECYRSDSTNYDNIWVMEKT